MVLPVSPERIVARPGRRARGHRPTPAPASRSASLLFFAAFALLLAVIVIYGLVSYAVVQRTREMGVRLALGSRIVQVRAMLLGQGLVAVLVGLLCGIFASLPSSCFPQIRSRESMQWRLPRTRSRPRGF